MHECQICHNTSGNQTVIAEEMMIGLRHRFSYLECGGCGCLQRLDHIDDLAQYYPPGYYSFSGRRSGFMGLAERARVRLYMGRSRLGRRIAGLRPRADLAALAALNPPKDWRILDVGCGSGKLLFELADAGFQHLAGVDPMIESEIVSTRVRVRKCDLRDLQETGWDLIMFHHSLEHMPNQEEVLRAAARLLKPTGLCLVRQPVVNWAWRHYREKWVQLDAPRHVLLHTERSLGSLAERAGMRAVNTYYDSGELQFWGSELYRRNIPLRSEGAPRRFFPAKTLRRYRKWANRLNRKRLGDQAVFILAKA
jgi:SAM-dependent methyltransferase